MWIFSIFFNFFKIFFQNFEKWMNVTIPKNFLGDWAYSFTVIVLNFCRKLYLKKCKKIFKELKYIRKNFKHNKWIFHPFIHCTIFLLICHFRLYLGVKHSKSWNKISTRRMITRYGRLEIGFWPYSIDCSRVHYYIFFNHGFSTFPSCYLRSIHVNLWNNPHFCVFNTILVDYIL